jgi:hypothetical protein
MIELGVGADLFRLVGGVFWIVMLGALAAALLVPKGRTGKVIAVGVVVGLFAAFPGRWAWERKQQLDAYVAKRDKALAIFNERCKGAGEKIYRTVEGVEGILLMKLRPVFDTNDQNANDPYGMLSDPSGDEFILSFLWGRNESGSLDRWSDKRLGYRYVEVVDADGKRYRYIGEFGVPVGVNGAPRMTLKKEPPPVQPSRYAVTFEDLTTPEERALWIAGGAIKVVDLQTNEVVAERSGYMMDRGLGAKGGFRQPWANAREWSCPRPTSTRDFVEQALKIGER